MFEASSVFQYFLALTVLHSFVKGVYYVGYQRDDRFPSNPSQKVYLNSTDQLYYPWTEWSPCSRTCGVGISKRIRSCHKGSSYSRHRKENVCFGETKEHKVCKVQECSPGTPALRALQCSRYNGRSIAGQHIKSWLPADQGSNPCELRCEAEIEERLVYGFGKVEDGTPCTGGLCLDGRCLKIGCDDRLGSSEAHMEDMCGVCGGRNSSCIHYKDVFLEQISPSTERRSDYHDIMVFPVGTRNIVIKQRIGENVLALRDRNIAILFHGNENRLKREHQIAGTYFIYSKEDNNSTEVLRARGPTNLELYMLVLLRSKNYGINYEYWLPVEPSHPRRFHFMATTTTFPPVFKETSAIQQMTPGTENPYFIPRKHTTTSPSLRNTITPSVHHKVAKPEPPVFRYKQDKSNHREPSYSNTTNIPIYGPKRKPFYQPEVWLATSLPEDPTDSLPNFVRSPSMERRVTRKSDFVLRSNPNFRTRKPEFDYYQRFRNSTFKLPMKVFRQKIENIPQQTQQDSGSVIGNDKRDSKWDQPELRREKVYKENKIKDIYQSHKPSSRWEYKFNSKSNDSLHSRGSHLTTPVSIAVLPLPDWKGHAVSARSNNTGSKHHTRASLTGGGLCSPCQRVRDQAKHFCTSDFVIKAVVLDYEFLHGETRYELKVLQSFKNTFALLPREYLWAPDTCRCPKLRIGKEYVIMGRSDNYYRRNESRLLIDKHCFVRIYNRKHDRRLLKLKKIQRQKCASKVS